MALKHGSTTITVLKHGSTNITTGKHGTTTVFTVSSGPSWHTVLSSEFFPTANESGQVIVSNIPSNATQVRISIQSYFYNFNTGEASDLGSNTETVGKNDTEYFYSSYSSGEAGNFEYLFSFSGTSVTVDTTTNEGYAGVQYASITKVEAYY